LNKIAKGQVFFQFSTESKGS